MWWLNRNKKLNVLVVGDKGQLGSYLKKLLQDDSRLEKSMFGVVAGVDLPEVDISKPSKDDSGSSETPPTEEGDGGGSLI